MKNNRFFWLCFLCMLIPTTPIHAQGDDDTYISLSIENDNLGGGTDRYYTSGIRATWFNAATNVPSAISEMTTYIPTFDLRDTTSTLFTVGHNIYTPEDITQESQNANDRPWAAFLYGSVGLANVTYNDTIPAHIDELEFTLGIVGPEALGKPTQRFVHKYVSNSPDPKGWRNQLDFEPGFIVSWQRRIPNALSYHTPYASMRLEPSVNISLGNIRTHAGIGGTVVIGSDQSQDTPPRVRPAIPGTGYFAPDNGLDWQLFAGVNGRLVARDIFLDGNTLSDSHSVDKEYLVGEASAGLSLSYDDYRLSYTINTRSKEFKAQEENSVFGSLTLTKRF